MGRGQERARASVVCTKACPLAWECFMSLPVMSRCRESRLRKSVNSGRALAAAARSDILGAAPSPFLPSTDCTLDFCRKSALALPR